MAPPRPNAEQEQKYANPELEERVTTLEASLHDAEQKIEQLMAASVNQQLAMADLTNLVHDPEAQRNPYYKAFQRKIEELAGQIRTLQADLALVQDEEKVGCWGKLSNRVQGVWPAMRPHFKTALLVVGGAVGAITIELGWKFARYLQEAPAKP
jgi:hypothetical protein